jgi:hypothetical protein
VPFSEPCPLAALPDLEYGYVIGREDRIVDPGWSRRVAAERLAVTPIELATSHSPFLSRPSELAHILHGFA